MEEKKKMSILKIVIIVVVCSAVLSIVPIIILVGVSISMMSGEDGILTQAEQASVDTKRDEIVERINIEITRAHVMLLSDEGVESIVDELETELSDIAEIEYDKSSGIVTVTSIEDSSIEAILDIENMDIENAY